MNLSLRGAGVKFGQRWALREVDVDFTHGTHAVICGSAGSGKTTLLKLLAGLRKPDMGKVLWQDVCISELSSVERRARQAVVGMVFQSDALFDSLTVLENVALPLRKRGFSDADALAGARAALNEVGLSEAEAKMPQELSGGMRKRTGIARAIVARPEVLLADDPFAGLDPETEKQIAAVMLKVAHQRTLIAALPDPSPALPMAQVWWVKNGELR